MKPSLKAKINRRILLKDLGHYWTPAAVMSYAVDQMMHEIFESGCIEKGAEHDWFYYADIDLSGPWIDLTLQNWSRPEKPEKL